MNQSLGRLWVAVCWLLFISGFAGAEQSIRPLDWSKLGDEPRDDTLAKLCDELMSHTQDRLAQKWLHRITKKTKQLGDGADRMLDFGHNEGHIRPNAVMARTLALAIRIGKYRADKSGASIAEIEKLLPLVVRSLAKDHKANGGLGDKAWGGQWQSAMWAAQTAQTAWIIWEQLTDQDRQWVLTMLSYEADRFLKKAPPTSNEKSVKDTKGEENAWNAPCMLTASLMLAGHPHEQLWRERAIVYYLNAVATPHDLNSQRVVDGKPLKERLVGYCITEDYAVGNHGAYPHPGYTASSYLDVRMLIFSSLAGVQPPQALLYNAEPIYRMFVDHRWQAPPYEAPGGTIYQPDGSIYWPIKKEKERAGRYYKWLKQDILAHTYGFDRNCSIKADVWAQKHGDLILNAMQGKKTAVKLDAYRKTAFFKTVLSGYLIRRLFAHKQLTMVQPLAAKVPSMQEGAKSIDHEKAGHVIKETP